MKPYLWMFYLTLFFKAAVFAHCQMPCGIYHDQMIYDKVDEFHETMFKGISALKHNSFSSLEDKNQFIRWVNLKEKMCDETALILTEYFLQQKVKPGTDEDTQEMVHVLHNLLFLLVQIKQNVDLDIVKQFGKEWEHFKYLFHPEMKCEHLVPVEPNWKPEDTSPKKGGSPKSNLKK